jgi:hypothetical protein
MYGTSFLFPLSFPPDTRCPVNLCAYRIPEPLPWNTDLFGSVETSTVLISVSANDSSYFICFVAVSASVWLYSETALIQNRTHSYIYITVCILKYVI